MGIFVSLKDDLPPNPILSFEASGLSIQSLCGLANGSFGDVLFKESNYQPHIFYWELTGSNMICQTGLNLINHGQDQKWSALNRFKLDEPGTG